MNTERLATLTFLPLASPSSNGVGATERACALAGKVKPAKLRMWSKDPSGQEENGAHMCARF